MASITLWHRLTHRGSGIIFFAKIGMFPHWDDINFNESLEEQLYSMKCVVKNGDSK